MSRRKEAVIQRQSLFFSPGYFAMSEQITDQRYGQKIKTSGHVCQLAAQAPEVFHSSL